MRVVSLFFVCLCLLFVFSAREGSCASVCDEEILPHADFTAPLSFEDVLAWEGATTGRRYVPQSYNRVAIDVSQGITLEPSATYNFEGLWLQVGGSGVRVGGTASLNIGFPETDCDSSLSHQLKIQFDDAVLQAAGMTVSEYIAQMAPLFASESAEAGVTVDDYKLYGVTYPTYDLDGAGNEILASGPYYEVIFETTKVLGEEVQVDALMENPVNSLYAEATFVPDTSYSVMSFDVVGGWDTFSYPTVNDYITELQNRILYDAAVHDPSLVVADIPLLGYTYDADSDTYSFFFNVTDDGIIDAVAFAMADPDTTSAVSQSAPNVMLLTEQTTESAYFTVDLAATGYATMEEFAEAYAQELADSTPFAGDSAEYYTIHHTDNGDGTYSAYVETTSAALATQVADVLAAESGSGVEVVVDGDTFSHAFTVDLAALGDASYDTIEEYLAWLEPTGLAAAAGVAEYELDIHVTSAELQDDGTYKIYLGGDSATQDASLQDAIALGTFGLPAISDPFNPVATGNVASDPAGSTASPVQPSYDYEQSVTITDLGGLTVEQYMVQFTEDLANTVNTDAIPDVSLAEQDIGVVSYYVDGNGDLVIVLGSTSEADLNAAVVALQDDPDAALVLPATVDIVVELDATSFNTINGYKNALLAEIEAAFADLERYPDGGAAEIDGVVNNGDGTYTISIATTSPGDVVTMLGGTDTVFVDAGLADSDAVAVTSAAEDTFEVDLSQSDDFSTIEEFLDYYTAQLAASTAGETDPLAYVTVTGVEEAADGTYIITVGGSDAAAVADAIQLTVDDAMVADAALTADDMVSVEITSTYDESVYSTVEEYADALVAQVAAELADSGSYPDGGVVRLGDVTENADGSVTVEILSTNPGNTMTVVGGDTSFQESTVGGAAEEVVAAQETTTLTYDPDASTTYDTVDEFVQHVQEVLDAQAASTGSGDDYGGVVVVTENTDGTYTVEIGGTDPDVLSDTVEALEDEQVTRTVVVDVSVFGNKYDTVEEYMAWLDPTGLAAAAGVDEADLDVIVKSYTVLADGSLQIVLYSDNVDQDIAYSTALDMGTFGIPTIEDPHDPAEVEAVTSDPDGSSASPVKQTFLYTEVIRVDPADISGSVSDYIQEFTQSLEDAVNAATGDSTITSGTSGVGVQSYYNDADTGELVIIVGSNEEAALVAAVEELHDGTSALATDATVDFLKEVTTTVKLSDTGYDSIEDYAAAMVAQMELEFSTDTTNYPNGGVVEVKDIVDNGDGTYDLVYGTTNPGALVEMITEDASFEESGAAGDAGTSSTKVDNVFYTTIDIGLVEGDETFQSIEDVVAYVELLIATGPVAEANADNDLSDVVGFASVVEVDILPDGSYTVTLVSNDEALLADSVIAIEADVTLTETLLTDDDYTPVSVSVDLSQTDYASIDDYVDALVEQMASELDDDTEYPNGGFVKAGTVVENADGTYSVEILTTVPESVVEILTIDESFAESTVGGDVLAPELPFTSVFTVDLSASSKYDTIEEFIDDLLVTLAAEGVAEGDSLVGILDVVENSDGTYTVVLGSNSNDVIVAAEEAVASSSALSKVTEVWDGIVPNTMQFDIVLDDTKYKTIERLLAKLPRLLSNTTVYDLDDAEDYGIAEVVDNEDGSYSIVVRASSDTTFEALALSLASTDATVSKHIDRLLGSSYTWTVLDTPTPAEIGAGLYSEVSDELGTKKLDGQDGTPICVHYEARGALLTGFDVHWYMPGFDDSIEEFSNGTVAESHLVVTMYKPYFDKGKKSFGASVDYNVFDAYQALSLMKMNDPWNANRFTMRVAAGVDLSMAYCNPAIQLSFPAGTKMSEVQSLMIAQLGDASLLNEEGIAALDIVGLEMLASGEIIVVVGTGPDPFVAGEVMQTLADRDTVLIGVSAFQIAPSVDVIGEHVSEVSFQLEEGADVDEFVEEFLEDLAKQADREASDYRVLAASVDAHGVLTILYESIDEDSEEAAAAVLNDPETTVNGVNVRTFTADARDNKDSSFLNQDGRKSRKFSSEDAILTQTETIGVVSIAALLVIVLIAYIIWRRISAKNNVTTQAAMIERQAEKMLENRMRNGKEQTNKASSRERSDSFSVSVVTEDEDDLNFRPSSLPGSVSRGSISEVDIVDEDRLASSSPPSTRQDATISVSSINFNSPKPLAMIFADTAPPFGSSDSDSDVPRLSTVARSNDALARPPSDFLDRPSSLIPLPNEPARKSAAPSDILTVSDEDIDVDELKNEFGF